MMFLSTCRGRSIQRFLEMDEAGATGSLTGILRDQSPLHVLQQELGQVVLDDEQRAQGDIAVVSAEELQVICAMVIVVI